MEVLGYSCPGNEPQTALRISWWRSRFHLFLPLLEVVRR